MTLISFQSVKQEVDIHCIECESKIYGNIDLYMTEFTLI